MNIDKKYYQEINDNLTNTIQIPTLTPLIKSWKSKGCLFFRRQGGNDFY